MLKQAQFDFLQSLNFVAFGEAFQLSVDFLVSTSQLPPKHAPEAQPKLNKPIDIT